jgi:hypothetical protein
MVVVHPKMILAAAVQFTPSALFSNRLGTEARAWRRAKIVGGELFRRDGEMMHP